MRTLLVVFGCLFVSAFAWLGGFVYLLVDGDAGWAVVVGLGAALFWFLLVGAVLGVWFIDATGPWFDRADWLNPRRWPKRQPSRRGRVARRG